MTFSTGFPVSSPPVKETIAYWDTQAIGESGKRTMFYHQVFKAGGVNIFANLQTATRDFRRIPYSESPVFAEDFGVISLFF